MSYSPNAMMVSPVAGTAGSIYRQLPPGAGRSPAKTSVPTSRLCVMQEQSRNWLSVGKHWATSEDQLPEHLFGPVACKVRQGDNKCLPKPVGLTAELAHRR
jgi:hypothetical protein